MAKVEMNTPTALGRLIDQAWQIYRRAEENGDRFVVRPSIPILYFGDSAAYFRSPVRVITVGLNPSLREFPAHDPFLRFPLADQHGTSERAIEDVEVLQHALNAYFRNEPYSRWFASYEEILRGAGASYYDSASSVALHTDLCSPLATDPTWSKLPRAWQASLSADGRALWHNLVRVLAPDVIVISIAGHHLDEIEFEPVDGWRTCYTLERRKPYAVTARIVEVLPDQRALLVFGRAAHTPFGTVSKEARRSIGAAIRGLLDAR